jgi:hypothetical protein
LVSRAFSPSTCLFAKLTTSQHLALYVQRPEGDSGFRQLSIILHLKLVLIDENARINQLAICIKRAKSDKYFLKFKKFRKYEKSLELLSTTTTGWLKKYGASAYSLKGCIDVLR